MNYRFYPYHFCGAFTATAIGAYLFGFWAGLTIAVLGSIGVEVYQWAFEKWYAGKELDTALDLMFDAGGIWIACVVMGGLA